MCSLRFLGMDEDSLDSCLIEVLAEECSKEGAVQPLDAKPPLGGFFIFRLKTA